MAFDHLGGDVVVKPIFGSEGRGIVRVSDRDLALRTFRTLERIGAVLYVQRFIENEGFDVRVLVLGKRVLGAMRRRANGDFRANISCRAIAEEYRPTDDECQMALGAAEATGARFAGVDLLYDRDGTCYVIEVNAVPGWRALQPRDGSRRGGRSDFEFAIVGPTGIFDGRERLDGRLVAAHAGRAPLVGGTRPPIASAQYRRLGQELGKRRHGRLDARRPERAGADRGRSPRISIRNFAGAASRRKRRPATSPGFPKMETSSWRSIRSTAPSNTVTGPATATL